MGSYTKALCNDGTQDVGDPTKAPCNNNGGIKNFLSGVEGWTGGINPNGMYTNNVTKTKVLCKDGKFDTESSSPNAKYDNSKTCMNNGGRADSQTVVNAPVPPTKSGDAFFPKLAGSYNKNLIIAVVLVAGYFAYKKFKK